MAEFDEQQLVRLLFDYTTTSAASADGVRAAEAATRDLAAGQPPAIVAGDLALFTGC